VYTLTNQAEYGWAVKTVGEREIIEKHWPGNMMDYEQTYAEFRFEDVEKEFTWHKTGRVNVAHEAIDRHADGWRKNKVALYADGPDGARKYTFLDLKLLSNKFANVLKSLGVARGDRVFTYMGRYPELYIAAIGTVKNGSVWGPLFGGFRAEAVLDRLLDSGAKALVTTPDLKTSSVDEILDDLPDLEHVIVVKSDGVERTGATHTVSFEAEMKHASTAHQTEWMDREDPVMMHYTSGTTGKAKGVVHVHNAMIGHYITTKYVQDVTENDIYWCTADPGWVTGTSYACWGPWLNGTSQVSYSGRFDSATWYGIIDQYQVTIWYTAPTALRLLMKDGLGVASKFDFGSLRYITSVGEPLNPEVIRWGLKAFKLPIHDNWWMTETGQILIANYPCMSIREGSMGRPFPSITASIVDDSGKELPPNTPGNLVIKPPWPALMRAIWKNEEKYKSYFEIPGWYKTGDSAFRDEDGYFWFMGRVDDVIKTSGERVGPFEVESALVEHPAVAEAGVIGKPDALRGEIIKAFVSLRAGHEPSESLKQDIAQFVKKHLAAHAFPREIEFMDKLPKTRSGKIMRRVLKAQELGLPMGDLASLDEE
jgi:acetyl-CoA synthetase